MTPRLIQKTLVVKVDDDRKISTQQNHAEDDRHNAADEKQRIRRSSQIFDQHCDAREGQDHTGHRAFPRRADDLLAFFEFGFRKNHFEQRIDQKADEKHDRTDDQDKDVFVHTFSSSTGAEMTYCTGISNASVSRWENIWNP